MRHSQYYSRTALPPTRANVRCSLSNSNVTTNIIFELGVTEPTGLPKKGCEINTPDGSLSKLNYNVCI